MTDLRDAARQALEALKPHSRIYQRNAAIEALSAALKKQGQGTLCNNTYGCQCPKHFTHQPRREWRGLDRDETMHLMNDTAENYWADEAHIQRFARAIEAALRSKNHA
jgi:hypothetical protein